MNDASSSKPANALSVKLSEEQLSRFFSKVMKLEDCWEWGATVNNQGYGVTSWEGSNQLAHRVSYAHHVADIPQGKCVLHRCDNPRCVRPDHLFLGTMKDNYDDMESKGRGCRGSDHGMAKVTEDQVCEIRELYAKGFTQVFLAKKYGLTGPTLSVMIRGKKWRHAGGPIADKWINGTPRRVTPEQYQDIVARINNGERIVDIAKLYSVSQSMICSIKRKLGKTGPEINKRNTR